MVSSRTTNKSICRKSSQIRSLKRDSSIKEQLLSLYLTRKCLTCDVEFFALAVTDIAGKTSGGIIPPIEFWKDDMNNIDYRRSKMRRRTSDGNRACNGNRLRSRVMIHVQPILTH